MQDKKIEMKTRFEHYLNLENKGINADFEIKHTLQDTLEEDEYFVIVEIVVNISVMQFRKKIMLAELTADETENLYLSKTHDEFNSKVQQIVKKYLNELDNSDIRKRMFRRIEKAFYDAIFE